jgi:group I intron endonuclease
MTAGVYEILNTQSGKRYVGSALNIHRRWAEHRSGLRRGKHHSRHLQCAWNAYGEAEFEFRQLIVCAPQDLLLYEQIAIDTIAPEYNVLQNARNSLGRVHTPETRAKISAKAMGRKYSPETIEKRAAKRRGVPLAPEVRAKLLGNQYAAGLKHTDEWKAANSARNSGVKRPKDAEYRAKISASLKGRKATPEHRANQSAAQLGKKRDRPYKPWSEQALLNHPSRQAGYVCPMQGKRHSDDARRRMSEANLGQEVSRERRAAIGEATRVMWTDPEKRKLMVQRQREAWETRRRKPVEQRQKPEGHT